MQTTLHLLMGLPGAGKSTFARTLHRLTGAEILSSDEARLKLFTQPTFSQDEHDKLYEILDHNLKHLLEKGYSAIYDANLNRRCHREEKYSLASEFDTKVVLWWLQVPSDLARSRRVNEQNHDLLPAGETPEKMFDRIAQILEAPKDDEPYIVVDGTRISEDYVKELLELYS